MQHSWFTGAMLMKTAPIHGYQGCGQFLVARSYFTPMMHVGAILHPSPSQTHLLHNLLAKVLKIFRLGSCLIRATQRAKPPTIPSSWMST